MAAPTFVRASTGTTDSAGAWTHTATAPDAAGNLYIVHAVNDGTNSGGAGTIITSVTNAETLAGVDNNLTSLGGASGSGGDHNVGAGPLAFQQIWLGRALNTSAMVITGANTGGDDVYVRVYEFANVNTGTTLADVIENVTAGTYTDAAGTSGTIADVAVTTLGPDRMALNFVGINDDNAVAAFTGETGGDWTEAVAEYADATGTDACIQLQTAQPADFIDTTAGPSTGSSSVFGGSGTLEQAAQSFLTPASACSLTSVVLALKKVGTPTDNVVFEVQTDSGGAPSGSVVGTVATIAGATLTAAELLYTNACQISLDASTTYWLVESRSGTRDTSNYFFWGAYTADTYADGVRAHRDSGVWANFTGDTMFKLTLTRPGTINGGTATNPDATDGWGVVGFALIGTTPSAVYQPRSSAINFQDPAVL